MSDANDGMLTGQSPSFISAMSMELKLYSREWCSWCIDAKEYLSARGYSFVEIDVGEDITVEHDRGIGGQVIEGVADCPTCSQWLAFNRIVEIHAEFASVAESSLDHFRKVVRRKDDIADSVLAKEGGEVRRVPATEVEDRQLVPGGG